MSPFRLFGESMQKAALSFLERRSQNVSQWEPVGAGKGGEEKREGVPGKESLQGPTLTAGSLCFCFSFLPPFPPAIPPSGLSKREAFCPLIGLRPFPQPLPLSTSFLLQISWIAYRKCFLKYVKHDSSFPFTANILKGVIFILCLFFPMTHPLIP